MSKQTAVEWLVDELLSGKPLMPCLIEQAKKMQEEQIMKAYYDGGMETNFDPNTFVLYYQETYGGDDE